MVVLMFYCITSEEGMSFEKKFKMVKGRCW
jgi:hypothetical protein